MLEKFGVATESAPAFEIEAGKFIMERFGGACRFPIEEDSVDSGVLFPDLLGSEEFCWFAHKSIVAIGHPLL